uniref:uncharacterized protein LOC120348487 n=1 Tax=Styela clava TaxID=7725 RepID=UPI00193A959A|nr:uncharacterized protein LOC120348487 [Styela clava]
MIFFIFWIITLDPTNYKVFHRFFKKNMRHNCKESTMNFIKKLATGQLPGTYKCQDRGQWAKSPTIVNFLINVQKELNECFATRSNVVPIQKIMENIDFSYLVNSSETDEVNAAIRTIEKICKLYTVVGFKFLSAGSIIQMSYFQPVLLQKVI